MSEHPDRAGSYIRQLEGYRAFIPKPLPPDPPVRITGELQVLLSQADRALGRLDGSVQTLPHADLFVLMCARKGAVLSSQIEGTQGSLQDLLAAEARNCASRRMSDVGEVVNCVKAMNHGLSRLSEIPVSIRLIREIHAELIRGRRGPYLLPGALRSSQNWVGPAGSTLAEAAFVPPPPQQIPEGISQLEKFFMPTRHCPY